MTTMTTATTIARQTPIKNGQKEKIRLQGVEQTMLSTIYLKCRDSQSSKPILGDPHAAPLLDRCDVDLEDSHFKHVADERYVQFILKRTKQLDQWCQEFIDTHTAKNEPVTIIHLACGLDCRHLRVKRGPKVRWIDIDRPLAVDLRSQLLPIEIESENYALRTLSIGTQWSWLRDIPVDCPTLVIAEGLFYHLEPAQTEQAIHDIVDYFGKGALIFDILGHMSVKLTSMAKFLKTSKSTFNWSLEEPGQIEALHPNLRLSERVKWKDFMKSHPPFFGEKVTKVLSLLPSFANNIQLWRFDFGEKAADVPSGKVGDD